MPTEGNSQRKIEIVTGGSRGIGRSIVLSLAQRRDRSIFIYNANHAEAEKVVGLAEHEGQIPIASQLPMLGRLDASATV